MRSDFSLYVNSRGETPSPWTTIVLLGGSRWSVLAPPQNQVVSNPQRSDRELGTGSDH